jgi:hypothetical protein
VAQRHQGDGSSFQTVDLGGGQLNIGHYDPPGTLVPEPSTYALMALGLGAPVLVRRRRRRR